MKAFEKNLSYKNHPGSSQNDILEIEGDTYYFNFDGSVRKNTIEIRDGIFYKFGADGKAEVIQQGAEDGFITVGESTYYIKDGELVKNQFMQLDGYTYHLNYDGTMQKNIRAQIYNPEDPWGKYFYQFDQEGHLLYGWQMYGDDQWYYYDLQTGQGFRGLREIDGVEYYFYETKNGFSLFEGMLYGNISIQIEDKLY